MAWILDKNSIQRPSSSPRCYRTLRAMECDVAKRETIQAAFRTIATEGTLTTVINAAGINTDGLVPRLSPSALDSMLTVNLAGAIAVTSEATRLMLRQRQRGSIINISSATAHVANPGQSIYSATKAGLEGFTRTAARELAPKQIRLNCIAPGYVDTDMTRHLDSSKLVASIPLGRLGAYEDVTQAAEYLISSDYVTGQTIVVDGGLSL
eukprot:TRINITY_DN12438_c1_g1_i5.p2 TRINITY_DN12438_c1_g1~~TRINITY_DN12438_c1_g1_i5.p2  ORF type:complete len:209 (+),score=18.02 TRINITY_DN12438_c1_g1_i5:1413-2039(+)